MSECFSAFWLKACGGDWPKKQKAHDECAFDVLHLCELVERSKIECDEESSKAFDRYSLETLHARLIGNVVVTYADTRERSFVNAKVGSCPNVAAECVLQLALS